MAHVFVSPHPDDVALSCGGLLSSLRELGQNVTILTVFSGAGELGDLTDYQREALGFGSKVMWPDGQAFNRASLANDYQSIPVIRGDDGTGGDIDPGDAPGESLAPWSATPDRLEATQAEADAAAKRFWQRSSWYRRADIHAHSLAGQPVMDDVAAQGALITRELTEAEQAGDLMAARRLEDERYAFYQEASVVFLDLPDAVFRGYVGDDQLLAQPRPDDAAPLEIIRREVARLEPQQVYFPLGIGDHVDHQLLRNIGLALLDESRRWVMPGPDYVGRLVFYEDFPYAYWREFSRLEDLPSGALDRLPGGLSLSPEYADVTDVLDRKVNGLRLYRSQFDRLFGGEKQMEQAVRGQAARIGAASGLGAAERYWRAVSL